MDKPTITLARNKCYVDGQWVGEPKVPVTNKATGDIMARVPDFGEAETRSAIEAANRAFPAWSKMLAKERSKRIRKWFDLMIDHADELALLLTNEQGKPLAEAKGEILYAAGFVEWFAEEAKRVYGETIPTFKGDARIVVIKQPVGVVAAITPWNFPSAMITRKVAPALAVGCTVVCKPASETPLSALALAELADRAGIPKGVFNVVTGKASAIGKELTSNPDVRMLTLKRRLSPALLIPTGKLRPLANGVSAMSTARAGSAVATRTNASAADANDVQAARCGSLMRDPPPTCIQEATGGMKGEKHVPLDRFALFAFLFHRARHDRCAFAGVAAGR
jgi:hypothetical protein